MFLPSRNTARIFRFVEYLSQFFQIVNNSI
jgi:hypothetical protein